MGDPRFHHLQAGDVVEFKTGKRETNPTWKRGTVIGVDHPEASDPTAFILGPDERKYARCSSDVIFVERPAPPAPEEPPAVWRRKVTDNVALVVTDDHMILMDLTGDGEHSLSSDEAAQLVQAMNDCQAFVRFRRAMIAEWPGEPDRVREIVENAWPMSD